MHSPFGEFLRARRTDASLRPSVSDGVGHRRIPGLRREEVATAAGISVDYYTRLEQGRENHPSDAVVNALARALRLNLDAKEHLYQLRGSPISSARVESAQDPEWETRMTALVNAVSPNPAYILDRFSTMVAANAEGLELFDGFADTPPAARNTCRYLFTDPRARHIFLEWEELARGAVAHLRAANAHNLQDPELQALVTELGTQSPLFAECWAEHIVERRRASHTRIRSLNGGVISRQYEVLHLPDESLRMTIWLPGA